MAVQAQATQLVGHILVVCWSTATATKTGLFVGFSFLGKPASRGNTQCESRVY